MASSSSSSSSSYNSPCAACKFLRRKCMPGCIFAPYFPPEEPQKFANVHKIFGASNVTKLLNDLLPHQREDAVNSLAYEAEARVRDPVYGCVGAISFLQRQIQRLQKELDAANADLIRYACNEIIATTTTTPNPVLQQQHMAPPPPRRTRSIDHHQQFYHHQQQQGHQGQGAPPPAANFQVPYNNNLPWNNVDLQNRTSSGNGNDHINERGGGGGGGEGRM